MNFTHSFARLDARIVSENQVESLLESALILFRHGLGDCVQLTAVVQHLLRYRPNWQIDIQVSDTGKASVFAGFDRIRAITSDGQRHERYDHYFDLEWHEPNGIHSSDVPATKAERCLRDVFSITPIPELCHYSIPGALEPDSQVDGYLAGISKGPAESGRFPVVAIHYEGNTSTASKNLSHETMRRVCDELLSLGMTPLILDWDRRSPLPDGKTIHCPDADHPLWKGYGTGDAGTLAKLINRCRLFIGIDSGPQKVAAATTTPMLCVWSKLHPIHYFPFSRDGDPFTRHVLRSCHADHFLGEHATGEALLRNYDCRYYAVERPDMQIIAELRSFFSDRDSIRRDSLRNLPKRPLEPFVVGVPTMNRYDLCRGLLDSVFAGTVQPERVFVIDNGESHEAFSYPDARVSVFRAGRNLGVARSWNLLYQMSRPWPLVITNDDIELRANCLEKLVTCNAEFATIARGCAYQAFLARESIWEKVGAFDEAFYPAYCEDNDHARRIELAGCDIVEPENDGAVQRGPSATRSAMSEEKRRWLDGCADANRAYYVKKWGGLPDAEVFMTPFNSPAL